MATDDPDLDGSRLLTSADVGPLLAAAVEHAGGTLVAWTLEQVDADPSRSTTATYAARVDWPYGQRTELLGVSARAGGPADTDVSADIFADGEREVAVWLYPNDPDLPGLARAAYAESMAEICNAEGVFGRVVRPSELKLSMIGYRPRRRAVVEVADRVGGDVVYVKVLRERLAPGVIERHRMLARAGVPAPAIRAVTADHLLVLSQLPGEPLADAVFAPTPPCSAADLIDLLDALPPAVAGLERRPSWAQTVGHYAGLVTAAVPRLESRLADLAETITAGLTGLEPGDEPTHGDFHEGQLHVADGRIVGLMDVDTLGPGRRADDLACLVAHLSTIQRMTDQQTERVHRLIRDWVPVFDERVDPVELRLRAAAVVISLATGPFRAQEPGWEAETASMIGAAEALVRQVC